LEPGNATIISHAGVLARILGRFEESTALGRRAIQLDPLMPGNYQNGGISFYYAGRYEEAADAFRKALELDPERGIAHCLLGRVYLAQSRHLDALGEMQKEKHPAFRLFGLALAYHALGRREESDASLDALIKNYQPEYQTAEVYAFRGEKERAFEWLDRATGGSTFSLLKGDPLMKSIASDPRYKALLAKARLPF
jgi:tetratricopeptide (TPR) repeat protein